MGKRVGKRERAARKRRRRVTVSTRSLTDGSKWESFKLGRKKLRSRIVRSFLSSSASA